MEYAVVGDIDPRVGEHLLDVLAAEGIAAYLQPAADLHPVTRTTELPARPMDRLFADRAHLQTAQTRLAELSPDDDLDVAWANIVAGFDTKTDASWPPAEDVTAAEPDGDGPDAGNPDAGNAADGDGDQRSFLRGLDRWGAPIPDIHEGYTAPPPPPLPRLSAQTVVGIVGTAVGLAIFFSPGLLPIDGGLALFVGVVVVVAGVTALIRRLRPGDDEEHDPDDGAVV